MKKHALILYLIFAQTVANANQCASLFQHEQKTFQFSILPKKSTKPAFSNRKTQVLDQDRLIEISIILETIKDLGLEELTPEEREKLIQFRLDISFLRSTYELLSKDHKSPKKFDAFVKTFGKLKDLMLMNESDKAQAIAVLILENFDPADFSKLIVEKPLAGKKSIKSYVKRKTQEIQKMISQRTTVDEVHTVRKSIRNLYRYLSLQKNIITLDEKQSEQFMYQLKYLKQINQDLGVICDTNASLILNGQIKKTFPYKLDSSLMQRIEYFISTFSVDYAEPNAAITKDAYE